MADPDDDLQDGMIGAWIVVACIIGSLAVMLTAIAFRGCAG